MPGLPDLDTIETLLAVVEARDPATTTTSRFDEDHRVLLATQSEILDALSSELSSAADKDRLRLLLDRIENDVETNRSRRKNAIPPESDG